MSTPAIRVSGLSKRFRIGGRARYKSLRESLQNAIKAPFRRGRRAEDTIWALRDVSFEVAPGEVVGVIGRNGAGKSTLLKVLSRITEPTEGRVELCGRVGSLLEVGTGFHQELTGRENIYLNGAILGMKRVEIERKFDEIVAFAEVERFLDTPVKHYSTGMYLRLAFGVAAHLEPEILLVDEVLAVGDAAFQKKCLGKMGEVAGAGRTVVFVSHNMAAVEALCRKTLLLDGGRVTALGDTEDVVNEYLARLAQHSTEALASGGNFIRAVRTLNSRGEETQSFAVRDDIIFDIELFHPGLIDRPRVSIGVLSSRGERLVTIHSDVQQADTWAFSGSKRIRATWRSNPMVPARYRIDIAFWGFASEIETLPACKHLDILPRDVYGTGALPDPTFQGFLLPDARWDMNPEPFNEPPSVLKPPRSGR